MRDAVLSVFCVFRVFGVFGSGGSRPRRIRGVSKWSRGSISEVFGVLLEGPVGLCGFWWAFLWGLWFVCVCVVSWVCFGSVSRPVVVGGGRGRSGGSKMGVPKSVPKVPIHVFAKSVKMGFFEI